MGGPEGTPGPRLRLGARSPAATPEQGWSATASQTPDPGAGTPEARPRGETRPKAPATASPREAVTSPQQGCHASTALESLLQIFNDDALSSPIKCEALERVITLVTSSVGSHTGLGSGLGLASFRAAPPRELIKPSNPAGPMAGPEFM
ncbi:hypothetical protein NDU88_002680 [Pleurodeles waltl]|uniref:Uncharacterized protein n=1 Tax=Pleurodeles waltl TaxID=8319 RepID=A0AAV7UBW9_PLEWA|nr:hypothetical protein NDU88_002680 [Pleurodeles waltl]